VQIDSNSAWARGCLSWAELRAGNVVAAAWHAWFATRLAEEYADARTLMGMALARAGLETAALHFFEHAIALDPHRSWGYLELARLLTQRGAGERALSLLTDYLALEPLDDGARALAAELAGHGGV
jgi:tetratricopeptide (TPR) repeat protein